MRMTEQFISKTAETMAAQAKIQNTKAMKVRLKMKQYRHLNSDPLHLAPLHRLPLLSKVVSPDPLDVH